MTNVLQFPGKPPAEPSNGALEIVADYLSRVHIARVMARSLYSAEELKGLDVLPDPDHFLAWLWEQGFKVVPVDD